MGLWADPRRRHHVTRQHRTAPRLVLVYSSPAAFQEHRSPRASRAPAADARFRHRAARFALAHAPAAPSPGPRVHEQLVSFLAHPARPPAGGIVGLSQRPPPPSQPQQLFPRHQMAQVQSQLQAARLDTQWTPAPWLPGGGGGGGEWDRGPSMPRRWAIALDRRSFKTLYFSLHLSTRSHAVPREVHPSFVCQSIRRHSSQRVVFR